MKINKTNNDNLSEDNIKIWSKKMISYRTKMLEKQIVKEFIQLFKLKYQKHWYANRLIKTVSEGARLNGAYRCGLIKGVADFLFDYPDKRSVLTDSRIEGARVEYITKYRNLWIEFKAGKNKQTIEQIEFQKSRQDDGSKYIICYSAEEAMREIRQYLGE